MKPFGSGTWKPEKRPVTNRKSPSLDARLIPTTHGGSIGFTLTMPKAFETASTVLSAAATLVGMAETGWVPRTAAGLMWTIALRLPAP